MSLQRPASLTDAFLESLVARVPSTSGGSWKLTEVYTGDLLVELVEGAGRRRVEVDLANEAPPIAHRQRQGAPDTG